MTKIYLDNNFLRYLINGFPNGFDAKAEAEALDKLIADSTVDFCISLWNLMELAGSTLEEGKKYATLIERLDPIWLSERRYIQKAELKEFIYTEIQGIAVQQSNPVYNDTFSQMMVTIEGMEAIAFVGETPRRYIEYLCTHEDSAEPIRRLANEHPDVLKRLQEAHKDKVKWREIELQGFKQTLARLLPERDAEGKHVSAEQKVAWLQVCLEKRESLQSSCPAIAVEDYLTDFRTRNPERNPQPSDALDYQHAVTATPYTDVLVTNDGYLTETASFCAKHLLRDFKIYKSLSKLD